MSWDALHDAIFTIDDLSFHSIQENLLGERPVVCREWLSKSIEQAVELWFIRILDYTNFPAYGMKKNLITNKWDRKHLIKTLISVL